MKKRLKIAIYSGAIPSTTFIEHLITEVAKHHDVLLFGNIKKKTHYNNKNIKVITTPYTKWQYILLTSWRVLRLLFKRPKHIVTAWQRAKLYPTNYLKLIRFTRYIAVLLYAPDIFHIQWPRRLERWSFLKDAYDCKIMVSLLGTQISIAPYNNEQLVQSFKEHFPKVDAFNAVSKATAQEAIQFGASRDSVHVIFIPIVDKAFKLYKLPKINKDRVTRIISVGRYDWVKGYRYAIQAIQLLKKEHISITYTIVAQGQVPEELIFQVHQLGLEHQVFFKNGIPQEDLFNEIQQHDVMLLPSVSEGVANVVIEAMALGVPVISTNCGGMSEVITTNETGWLIPSRDSNAICEAIKTYNNTSEEQIKDMVKEAHDFAMAHFHPENNIPQFIDLYEKIANQD